MPENIKLLDIQFQQFQNHCRDCSLFKLFKKRKAPFGTLYGGHDPWLYPNLRIKFDDIFVWI